MYFFLLIRYVCLNLNLEAKQGTRDGPRQCSWDVSSQDRTCAAAADRTRVEQVDCKEGKKFSLTRCMGASLCTDASVFMLVFGRCITSWTRCPSTHKFTNTNPLISFLRTMRRCGEDRLQNSSTLWVCFGSHLHTDV